MAEIAAGQVFVDRARRLADEVLFPNAQDVDRADRIPSDHLQALAAAGLFGIAGPERHGGTPVGRGDAWQIGAALFGGCAATTFVWAQHHGVVRTLGSSANTELSRSLLDDLCAGTQVAGIAFAHLRRRGRPPIAATRTTGGWRFDGFSPWTTSWGIADWFAIAGESDEGEVVWAMLPAGRTDGVEAASLALPVFMATGTVTLSFDGWFVPDEYVAAIEPADEWRRVDRRQSAIGAPATLGIAERSIRLLREFDDPAAAAAAERLATAHEAGARRYGELVQATAAGEDVVTEASDHRAALIDLAQRSATALLAASGGRGMDLAHPAQRLAREAQFFVIQAQTGDGRTATLRAV